MFCRKMKQGKKGTTIATLIKSTIQRAMPTAKTEITVRSNLVLTHDETGVYHSLPEFANIIYHLSLDIENDPKYNGVTITYDGITVKAIDDTYKPGPKKIDYLDFIGQPTWSAVGHGTTIQAKFALRGDLDIGDIVQLPPNVPTITTSESSLWVTNQQAFSGKFQIIGIHHFGNFRQPDAASWVTVVDMITLPAQTVG